jgi:hypothetical protein
MKRRVMLTIASQLSILLFSFHLTDDIDHKQLHVYQREILCTGPKRVISTVS